MCREILDAAASWRRLQPPPVTETCQVPPLGVARSEAVQTGLTQQVSQMDIDDQRTTVKQTATRNASRAMRTRRQNPSALLLRCTMCGDNGAHEARDSKGLLQHMVRSHMGQVLPRETIEQLRALGKEACQICSSIRARTLTAVALRPRALLRG